LEQRLIKLTHTLSRFRCEARKLFGLVGALSLVLGWVILLKAQRIGRHCGVAYRDVGGVRRVAGGQGRAGKSMATVALFLSCNNWSHFGGSRYPRDIIQVFSSHKRRGRIFMYRISFYVVLLIQAMINVKIGTTFLNKSYQECRLLGCYAM
jgi:hypothetical protein